MMQPTRKFVGFGGDCRASERAYDRYWRCKESEVVSIGKCGHGWCWVRIARGDVFEIQ